MYRIFTLLLLLAPSLNAFSAASPDNAAIAADIRSQIEARHTAVVSDSAASTMIGELTLVQGVERFYQARDYAPVWRDTATVDQLLHEIENLRDDGLDPEDYYFSQLKNQFSQLKTQLSQAQARREQLRSASNSSDSADSDNFNMQLANFDLLATRAYLRSLGHLFRGKINPATLEPQWNFPRNDMIISDALQLENEGIAQRNLSNVYEHMRPQHSFYQRARIALQQLHAIAAAGGWPTLETDIALKPGMSDPRIRILRQRLLGNTAASGNEIVNADVYDPELVAAVRKYQREQYLNADGIVGRSTLTALNIPVSARIDQLRVNMERARWLLHDLQGDFVLVDIAGYKIYFFRQGQVIWSSLVQVGRPARKSPVFRGKITYITFNPTWTVPPTIFRKDVMPKVKKDSGYLAENNIRVFDTRGHELDPKTINWNRPGDIVLRQDAGDDAALGQVAIRFPNPYSVYLHDTPHRELFGNEQRAFSSGCIRVERPLELVELLFNDAEKWNRSAIDQFIATGETRNVNLPKPVSILLAYWTVDLFGNGDVGFKPDIYERDAPLLKALNTTF